MREALCSLTHCPATLAPGRELLGPHSEHEAVSPFHVCVTQGTSPQLFCVHDSQGGQLPCLGCICCGLSALCQMQPPRHTGLQLMTTRTQSWTTEQLSPLPFPKHLAVLASAHRARVRDRALWFPLLRSSYRTRSLAHLEEHQRLEQNSGTLGVISGSLEKNPLGLKYFPAINLKFYY